MAMELRYAGEFLSKDNVAWRCEILQESDVAFAQVGELSFPATEPLVIEWPERGKEEPMCGSSATLTVISPSDRTYAGLYTVKPGEIRMDVYRAGILYWSGCLDSEFYEEPYDSAAGYNVTLTFSDFGILDRLLCDLGGSPTLEEYLEAAISASRIRHSGVDTSMISTQFPSGTALTPAALAVRADNFTDEDGIRSSWSAVLSGLLQPLALKMIQRNGKIYVYDLNGLAASQAVEAVWDGTGSSMGTDRVLNRITVTFSPYGEPGLASGDMEYTGEHGKEWTNLGKDPEDVQYEGGSVPGGSVPPECYSFFPGWSSADDPLNIDFTIFISTAAESTISINSFCRWFKIEPMLGGEECEGVSWGFYVGHASLDAQGDDKPEFRYSKPGAAPWFKVMTTKRVYLPPLGDTQAQGIWLRLRQELLCDCRYNPFSDADDDNEKGYQEILTGLANLALIPVSVDLYGSEEGGSAKMHWTNRDITEEGHAPDRIGNLLGKWEEGASSNGDAWLMYCDPSGMDTLTGGSGLGGWKANRQNFGIPSASTPDVSSWHLPESFGRMPDGQYICYPPEGGWVEVSIYAGVWLFTINPVLLLTYGLDTFKDDPSDTVLTNFHLYDHLRWMLYKVPELSVVRKGTVPEEIGDDDMEFSGILNPDAKDDLAINTVCGTLDSPSPTARGVYMAASDGSQIKELSRAGVTDRPEQLLIGTLYSQYADRRTILSGEVAADYGALRTYTDAAQDPDKKFMVLSERQDCISGCSEVKLCELRADEYEGK